MSVPRQLPLPIRLRAASRFSTYCAGDNQVAFSVLRDLAEPNRRQQWWQRTPNPVVVLCGPAGVGKTHLLQALCAELDATTEEAIKARYLPLRELAPLGPEVMIGMEESRVICLDDVDHCVTDALWNRALFSLYRSCEERQSWLVLSAESVPATLPWALPDLASRVAAGTVLRLKRLEEADQRVALQMHAEQRGFELPTDVADYLLRRVPRDMAKLCQLIDDLDLALLAARRRLTLAFAREWLQHDVTR